MGADEKKTDGRGLSNVGFCQTDTAKTRRPGRRGYRVLLGGAMERKEGKREVKKGKSEEVRKQGRRGEATPTALPVPTHQRLSSWVI